MAIKQGGLGAVARDVDQDDRGATRQTHHLETGARQRRYPRPRPSLEQRNCPIDMAMHLPIRIEMRRFVGNPDVLDQGGHDGIVPALIDEALQACDVHGVPFSQAETGDHSLPLILMAGKGALYWVKQYGSHYLIFASAGFGSRIEAATEMPVVSAEISVLQRQPRRRSPVRDRSEAHCLARTLRDTPSAEVWSISSTIKRCTSPKREEDCRT